MKNVNIHVLGVRVHEKPIYRGGGAWKICRFKGVLDKKE